MASNVLHRWHWEYPPKGCLSIAIPTTICHLKREGSSEQCTLVKEPVVHFLLRTSWCRIRTHLFRICCDVVGRSNFPIWFIGRTPDGVLLGSLCLPSLICSPTLLCVCWLVPQPSFRGNPLNAVPFALPHLFCCVAVGVLIVGSVRPWSKFELSRGR